MEGFGGQDIARLQQAGEWIIVDKHSPRQTAPHSAQILHIVLATQCAHCRAPANPL